MHDVIIAGAGPAGASAAFICANEGLRTLLLDRAVFPRSKPCGGALAQRALSFLGGTLPDDLIEGECYGALVRFCGHENSIRSSSRIAVMVDRSRFDAYLAERAVRAGAAFRQGEALRDVIPRQEDVEVVTSGGAYRCSYLIGADGVNSIAARSVRPPFPRRELLFALTCTLPRESMGRDAPQEPLIDLTFGAAPMGYGWDFAHGSTRSIGVMGHASRFRDPAGALAAYARSQGRIMAALRGHFIPIGGIRRRITAGRIALAGDAAGFGDAFSGEGLVHALHSGTLAAQAVVLALTSRQGGGGLGAYADAADRLIRRDLWHALMLARAIDRFPRCMLWAFFRHHELVERYLDIPAGRTDYAGYRRWVLRHMPGVILRKSHTVQDDLP